MLLPIVSFLACFTSVISLFPQMYKTYKSKSARDISMAMLLVFCACSTCWIIYGVLESAKTVWITNAMMLICSVMLVVMKISYDKGTKKHA